MHPIVVFGIVFGGVVVCIGGYTAVHKLYEWYNHRREQKEYEKYVRMHAEKGRYNSVPVYEEDDDDDDNEPLGIWKQKRDSFNSNKSDNELRHRNVSLQQHEQVCEKTR